MKPEKKTVACDQVVPKALLCVDGYFAPRLLRHGCDARGAQIHGRGGI